MNAIMEAKQLYRRHGLDFERDLGFYLTNGVVISRPDKFIMAKPIVAKEGDDCWNPASPDCWYVHCAAGRGALAWFLSQAPFRLPLLAWRRFKNSPQNPLKIYQTDRFERLAA